MRRLLLLVSALVFVDTMLFAALTPLLPHFAHTFGLSKVRAGVLVAAYAAGALAGGLPGGAAAARLGPRRAVLVGLAGMGLASIGFAFAGSFWSLFAARLLQGLGSAFTWAGAFAWLIAAAPRERRGQLLLAVGLAVMTLQLEPTPTEQPSFAAIGRALRNYRFVAGLSLMALPALLFGILSVLGPLRLAAAGWGAAAIGAIWLTGAALETLGSPLAGRLVDARGRLLPVRISLVFGTVVSLALATGPRPLLYAPLIVLAATSYGLLFTPAFALIADGAEESGLPQGMGFGLMSAAWAGGAFVGPAAAGAIASATGDWIPFVLAAALCAVTLILARRASENERAAVLIDRLSGDPARVGGE